MGSSNVQILGLGFQKNQLFCPLRICFNHPASPRRQWNNCVLTHRLEPHPGKLSSCQMTPANSQVRKNIRLFFKSIQLLECFATSHLCDKSKVNSAPNFPLTFFFFHSAIVNNGDDNCTLLTSWAKKNLSYSRHLSSSDTPHSNYQTILFVLPLKSVCIITMLQAR